MDGARQHSGPEQAAQPPGGAADGLPNRQIAQHLFISQATAETHLRHAFQKLGITSRGSLPPLARHIAAPAQLRS